LGERDIILYRTHRATLADEDLAGFRVETDLNTALALKPDAVIVANPTALHLAVAIPAAEAGCALLLEKPISGSLERVDVLRDAVNKSGSRVLVGFQFRFHPTLNKARELIQSGALGKILTAHVHWGEYLPNWHPWEDYRKTYAARAELGGGVVVTLTHPLDYMRWLLGEVESLWSFNGHLSPLELDVEDVAEIGLRFANGAVGGVHVNYVQRPPVHRVEVVGTQGTLRWDNADGMLTHYQMPAEFGTWSAQPPAPVMKQHALPEGFERNVLFMDEMKHFISVARGEAQSMCSLDDGIAALKLAQGIYESQRLGQKVSVA
jgi:predicted dehydrogenase